MACKLLRRRRDLNSSTTGHIDIEINLEKYEIQLKVSDFQEYVLFVEEIEEEPGDGKISYAQQQCAG